MSALMRRHALLSKRGGNFRSVLLAMSPLSYHTLGDASGTTAVALAGSNGTYVGSPTLGQPPLLPGDVATSMLTDNAAKYARILQTLSGTGDFTISLAFKTSITNAQQLVLDQDIQSSSTPRHFLAINRGSAGGSSALNGAVSFFNFDGSTNRDCASNSADVSDAQAHLIVYGRSIVGGVATPFMEIDGIPQSLINGVSTGDIMTGTYWGIGQSIAFSGLPFNGYVGHFATWNRALTPAEKADLFTASGL